MTVTINNILNVKPTSWSNVVKRSSRSMSRSKPVDAGKISHRTKRSAPRDANADAVAIARIKQQVGAKVEQEIVNFMNLKYRRVDTSSTIPVKNLLDIQRFVVSRLQHGESIKGAEFVGDAPDQLNQNYVTDIVVKGTRGSEIRLSIKKGRGSPVLRNPRTGLSMFGGCIRLNCDYENAVDRFLDRMQGYTHYNQNNEAKYQLYYDVCNIIATELARISSLDEVKQLFLYLKGYDNYYLIQLGRKVNVFDMNNIREPTSINEVRREHSDTIIVDFNNGFSFKMRIHNCKGNIRPSVTTNSTGTGVIPGYSRVDLKFAVMTDLKPYHIGHHF